MINTILIVDDDPNVRYILEGLLLREGYHLEFACGGQEALEKAQVLIPSLILLDVMLPEIDGFEVCRKLRAMPLLAEVPIIIITSLEDRDSRLEGIRAGPGAGPRRRTGRRAPALGHRCLPRPRRRLRHPDVRPQRGRRRRRS